MKKWVTYMDYFATGEGMTIQMAMVAAKTKKEAVEKHLDLFEIEEKSIRDYFSRGVSVMNPTSHTAKKLFADYLVNGVAVLDNLAKAWSANFKFEVHYNHS
jgi:hypothetical protein